MGFKNVRGFFTTNFSMIAADNTEPIVSVVVPCRNERDHIEKCVRSILAQEPIPGGFEVIVADGLSDDGTREILDRIAREDARLRVIDNPSRTTARAMNLGVGQARGRYIAFMGAHACYAPDYLQSCLRTAAVTGADNVGGAMTSVGTSFLQSAIAMAHHSPFSAGGARWHDPAYEGPADTVFGGFYLREVFDRIGWFDETLVRNQDDELNLRLTRAGGRIWHSPTIKSWYYPRASVTALFRQYLQYGYWKVRVVQKHRRPASVRHLVPALFVGSLIVLPLAGVFWRAAFWAWLALLGAYFCSTLIASATSAARGGLKFFLVLPWIFPCYHLGYGLGFLIGLIHFVVLGRAPASAFADLTRSSATSPERASPGLSHGK